MIKVILLVPSWFSHKIIAETLSSALNSKLIYYERKKTLYNIVKYTYSPIIFIAAGMKSHIRTTLYFLNPRYRRFVYIGSTCVYKYSFYHFLAEQMNYVFVHPSKFHCEVMRKIGYKNVHHIPHAYSIDLDFPDDFIISKIKERKNKREKLTFLSIFTSNSGYKGIQSYLYSLEELKGNINSKIRIIIKTSDKKFPYRIPKNKNIIIKTATLSRNDIINLILSSDIVVVPSLIEGFGLPILEALRLGRPVITLNAPPMNEINNEKVGYLVKIEKRKVIYREERIDIFNYPNISDFAEKIEEAVNDPNWEEKCFNAFQYAKNNFNPYILYKKFLSI
jgi:glycosyltransferase involved in cell wall biosynthesis